MHRKKRIAVAAIIRDERSDILTWLGWYRNLGVDTLIIFDDGSSDGTTQIIRDAACCFDIRLYKIENQEGSHILRQKDVYLYVLKNIAPYFDWVGFFDADEFLFLEKNQNLADFFAQVPADVGAVAFNWCNYGSSGHVLKPQSPLIWAFDHHSTAQETINRHVKTFIRPAAWSGEWVNVHYFPLKNSRYVDASLNDMRWSKTPGISSETPDWSSGRILHYQARSMEHFIERAKRRRDVTLTVDDFRIIDRNELYAENPKKMWENIAPWIKKVELQSYVRAFKGLDNNQNNKSEYLNSEFNIYEIVHEHYRKKLFALYVPRAGEDKVFIFTVDEGGFPVPIKIEFDYRVCDEFVEYTLISIPSQNKFALQNPTTHKYLCALPSECNLKLSSSRKEISDWEKYSFKECDYPVIHPSLFLLLQDIFSYPVTLESISYFYKIDPKMMYYILPIAVKVLPPEETAQLEILLGFKIL
ncbi:hypothetical protein AA106555_2075 [Neokomagataea thailandica NBRC 106555]|uniref:Glycosyltransferase family 2 protein n=2 Tax=Neokomagataea TaxID=1223423 RepID=A0A4Y6VA11_9PROT|nr:MULTISPECIES: glycosyltransferase family 2 protein [Neokomagataea]QDH25530.1 glycosyltransferase family 2 protein [Neokomagataea tanensis]GBR55649.1 hypothetical protein AA106555_2075 [Neokomagataea thailandica NBRC 106555]